MWRTAWYEEEETVRDWACLQLRREILFVLSRLSRSMTRSLSMPRTAGIPNRLYRERRLCVQRRKLFTNKQVEPHKDRQGNWKQAWPHYVKSNGQQACAIADKPFEEAKEDRWEDVRTKKRVQEGVQDREVVTHRENSEGSGGGEANRHPESRQQRSSRQ